MKIVELSYQSCICGYHMDVWCRDASVGMNFYASQENSSDVTWWCFTDMMINCRSSAMISRMCWLCLRPIASTVGLKHITLLIYLREERSLVTKQR